MKKLSALKAVEQFKKLKLMKKDTIEPEKYMLGLVEKNLYRKMIDQAYSKKQAFKLDTPQ
jgi:hypothetical protein